MVRTNMKAVQLQAQVVLVQVLEQEMTEKNTGPRSEVALAELQAAGVPAEPSTSGLGQGLRVSHTLVDLCLVVTMHAQWSSAESCPTATMRMTTTMMACLLMAMVTTVAPVQLVA